MDIPPQLIVSAERLALTGSTAGIHRPFKAGRLVRLRRGYYVKTSSWVEATPAQRFEWSAAAVGLALEQPVFCGESAAVVLGVPTLRPPEFVDLATPSERSTGRRPATFVVHGNSVLAEKARNAGNHPLRYVLRRDAQAVVSGQFSCTSPVQTAMDVMCASSFSSALVIADGIARMLWKQGLLGQDACLAEHPAIASALDGISAVATRHRAARIAGLAHTKAESAGESFSRAVIELLGFEQPLQQHTIVDSGRFVARTDFWWPEQSIAGEFDGKQKDADENMRGAWSAEEAVYREKLREDNIRGLGFTVVRWNWADLEQPGRLRMKLLRAGLRPRSQSRP
ncbi:hypothetical protein [Arthrobacter bambusae]|uniref:hypothetical protein n=1 Tax=Arthrobacter bambusae TaxID=1338426 RepID=UPI0027817501|nr:hypothetical protein [Arthrobacter bambusae]MDQ0029737.1 hypothetical protein [Arthrobacter bambusae]MDQ0097745.1 hypothetical protein [Arthrobacter bambusae]